ncbi:DHHA1 domain-containing protein [Metabacillus herbersteinensis]|uniref:DHHA1 domain-containing protein n=1 Tax=Metabacillus herbersteinensis TaxID=283816 RepID=A0ABV6GFZ6_9BACI
MTTKLYYQSPYTESFSTPVTKQAKDEAGNWFVVLEGTAFYPTGGGQPHDTGNLNGISVVDVQEVDSEIRHYLESPLPDSNAVIHGEIDWNRRFDHMQQHAGQHLLSAAFEELFSYKTVSFHLGKEISTIDLAIKDLTEKEAVEVENTVNRVIRENRPIEAKWVNEQELSQYPLRKKLAVTENIRLVIVPDFDYNGCGGTHPETTGEVSTLKILSWEKQRKQIRISFVCGNRVLKQLHQKQAVLTQLTGLLNAPEQGMVEAVKRLLEQSKNQDKAIKEVKEELIQYEAKSFASQVETISGRKIIKTVFQNRPIAELQSLARSIIAEVSNVVIFLVAENEDKLQFVCARGSASDVNMKPILEKILPIINGKGGGSESFAQGGGENLLSGEELIDKLVISCSTTF